MENFAEYAVPAWWDEYVGKESSELELCRPANLFAARKLLQSATFGLGEF